MKKLFIAAGIAFSAATVPGLALAQTVVTVPSEVETYVVKEKTPSVSVESDVVVGSALPETVVVHPVPKYETYSYAIVNNKRVIVDAKTRKVVRIVN